jgi:serine/threonine protein kinase
MATKGGSVLGARVHDLPPALAPWIIQPEKQGGGAGRSARFEDGPERCLGRRDRDREARERLRRDLVGRRAAAWGKDSEAQAQVAMQHVHVAPDRIGGVVVVEAGGPPVVSNGVYEAIDLLGPPRDPRGGLIIGARHRHAAEHVREAFGMVDGVLEQRRVEGTEAWHVTSFVFATLSGRGGRRCQESTRLLPKEVSPTFGCRLGTGRSIPRNLARREPRGLEHESRQAGSTLQRVRVWRVNPGSAHDLRGLEERMAGQARKDREYESGERIPGTEYVVIRLEARGGHGALYLVRHHFLERKIQMLKTLRAFEPNRDLIERLKREAQMLAGMEHPHIVSVVGGGLTDEPRPRPYFVMERLRGRSLANVLPKAKDGVGLEATLKIARELADALHYVHETHGLVHRDIKPDNIFIQLTADGTITKLLDFGVLHIVSMDKRHTKEPAFIGTPAYAAPEQLFGDRPTPQTDIYALGLVLYELITGHHPFDDCKTIATLGKAHLDRAPPPFPSQVVAPVGLERLVLSMLAKKQKDRPESAQMVKFELGQIKRRVELGDVVIPTDINQTDRTPLDNILTMTRGEATDPGGPPEGLTAPSSPAARPRTPHDTLKMSVPVTQHDARPPRLGEGAPAHPEKTLEDAPIGFLPTLESPRAPGPPTTAPAATPPATDSTPETGPRIDRSAPTHSLETRLPTPKPKTDTDVLAVIVQAIKRDEPAQRVAPDPAPVTTSAPSETAIPTATRTASRREGVVRATVAGALVGMGLVTAWALSTRSQAVPAASIGPNVPAATASSYVSAPAPASAALPSVAEATPAKGMASSLAPVAPSSVVGALSTLPPTQAASDRPEPSSRPASSRPPKDDVRRSMDPTLSPEQGHAHAPAPPPPGEKKRALPGSGL